MAAPDSPWLMDRFFWLHPHMVERERERASALISLYEGANPITRAPPP